MKSLYKTTMVIWSDYDPGCMEINAIAQEAVDGDMYCSVQKTEFIKDPTKDKQFDDCEFFGEEDDKTQD